MKDRVKNFIRENFLSSYIIINILYIFISSCIFTFDFSYYKKYGNSLLILLIINIIVGVCIFIKKKFKDKNYKFRIYDILLILLTLLVSISTIFSIRIDVSLYGSNMRYEGLFAILYYYSLVYLSSFVEKEKKKRIILTIIFTGVIQSAYAFLQASNSKLSFVKIFINDNRIMATGFLNNPNFLAAHVLICLAYAIGLFIDNDDTLTKIFYGHIIVALLIGLYVSNTTSCALALIFIFIYTLIYCIKNKKIKDIIIIVLISILGAMFFQKAGMTNLLRDLNKTKNEAIQISEGVQNDHFGTKRLLIWKLTLPVVSKYLVHGTGPDNFLYAFGNRPLIIYGTIYDKAHNDYLNILVTQGLGSLICYLLLFGIVVVRGIRNNYKNKEIYLILPVGGYLIQNFFNISVIEVAPIFYISLGLLIDRDDNPNKKLYRDYLKRIFDIILSIIFFIVLLPIMLIISILIIIIDRMSPLYIQKRTGKNGENFSMLKFKTMKDKKVTRFGSVLRVLSIDELPQLLNIIKGDMSLIGPRPWIIDYYERFDDRQKRRVEVRPGIIGLAQVNGRNNISVLKKIDYDIFYIDNLSLFLDLKIVLKSLKVIINSEDTDNINERIELELKELENINKSKIKKKQNVKKVKIKKKK